MKKLLSLLMVSMLVVTLAVPAFADDTAVIPAGKYTFDLILSPPAKTGVTNGNVTFVSNDTEYVSISVDYGSSWFNVNYNLANGAMHNKYQHKSSGTGWGTAESPNRDVYISEPASVSVEFYEWFTANTHEWTCDGSTCPATDVNEDEICDDCGARILRMVAPPDGWPSNMPAPPTSFDSNSQYILMTKDDGYTYLYVFTPYDASPVSEWNTIGSVHNSMQLKMFDASGNGVNVKRLTYRLSDDGEWYQHDSQSVDSTLFGDFEEIDMIYSTLSFYKEDGTLFFPLPLWAEVEKVTQGEMMTALAETLGTMKTLMVCGVGCLALLVVLSLYGKRSLISRG